MMDQRWTVFWFSNTIPEEEQKDVPPCGACFNKLLFSAQLYLMVRVTITTAITACYKNVHLNHFDKKYGLTLRGHRGNFYHMPCT